MTAVLTAAKNKLNYSIIEDSLDADVAVIWSVLWNGRMASNQSVYNHYISQGKPVIVIDAGAIRRNVTWKLAVNHINAYGYYGHTENLDYDRPGKFGISLTPTIKNNGAVLIAGQHKKSLQLASCCQEDWINEQIRNVQKVSDRPIVIRSHPRSLLDVSRLIRSGVTHQSPRKVLQSYDDFDIDYGYHAVINYNSGPGIQAGLAGAQVIVDESSLAFPISNQISNIDNWQYTDRSQWIVNICHTEYTVDELLTGTWCDRIASAL